MSTRLFVLQFDLSDFRYNNNFFESLSNARLLPWPSSEICVRLIAPRAALRDAFWESCCWIHRPSTIKLTPAMEGFLINSTQSAKSIQMLFRAATVSDAWLADISARQSQTAELHGGWSLRLCLGYLHIHTCHLFSYTTWPLRYSCIYSYNDVSHLQLLSHLVHGPARLVPEKSL